MFPTQLPKTTYTVLTPNEKAEKIIIKTENRLRPPIKI